MYSLMDEAICENMKLHKLDKVKKSLEAEKYQVNVPKEVADKARKAVERMLEVS